MEFYLVVFGGISGTSEILNTILILKGRSKKTRKVGRSTIVSSTIHFNFVQLGFVLRSIILNIALIKHNLGRGFCSINILFYLTLKFVKHSLSLISQLEQNFFDMNCRNKSIRTFHLSLQKIRVKFLNHFGLPLCANLFQLPYQPLISFSFLD